MIEPKFTYGETVLTKRGDEVVICFVVGIDLRNQDEIQYTVEFADGSDMEVSELKVSLA